MIGSELERAGGVYVAPMGYVIRLENMEREVREDGSHMEESHMRVTGSNVMVLPLYSEHETRIVGVSISTGYYSFLMGEWPAYLPRPMSIHKVNNIANVKLSLESHVEEQNEEKVQCTIS